jgi:hypothetical protein
MKIRNSLGSLALTLLMSSFVVGCSGGGGNSPSKTIGGVAAVGAPIVNGTITVSTMLNAQLTANAKPILP